MKKLMPILLIFCTALTITAGFLLPCLVSSTQDLKLQKRVCTYTTDGLHFHPVAQLSDSLRLVAGNYTWVDLSSNHRKNPHHNVHTVDLSGGSRLNADGAYKAALDALKFLTEQNVFGIKPTGYPAHLERAFLAVSADQSTSAVLWACELRDDNAGEMVQMLIDDRSGKMLMLDVVTNRNPLEMKGETNPQKQANEFFVRLANTFSRYYGLQYKSIQLGTARLDPEYSQLNGLPNCYYNVRGSVTLRATSGETLTVPLGISCGTYVFNRFDYMSVG